MKSDLSVIFKNRILIVSSALLIGSSVIIYLFTNQFYNFIGEFSLLIRSYFGFFYLALGLFCVIFLLIFAFSKFGRIRLGTSPPEFDRISWIAMLYSAGMGAGILLRAVQEPVFMYINPPIETGNSREIISLEYTFYQWGFTAWAFYGIFAVIIGYSIFVDKKNIRLGTGLPLFGNNKSLIAGIDLLTIFTTVIGLVAAIGLGTTQVEGGLSHLFGQEPGSLIINLFLVFIVCLTAFLSAWAGVQKGIKKISNWNIIVAIALMLFVLFTGNISSIFENFFRSLYQYVTDFIPLSLALGKYDPGTEFLTHWTYYYWAFWLAWAPFTGIFIARISKGRTLRELIFGVLLIPSLGSFFWFSVFGTSAFALIGDQNNYNGEFANVFTSLFVFFENYPFGFLTSIIVILLLISFLVTSVDSAIFVLSMFTDKGKQEPRKIYRLLWAILIFIFCEAIIVLGEVKPDSDVLSAVQKLLIITSLPFAFLTLTMSILFALKILKIEIPKKLF